MKEFDTSQVSWRQVVRAAAWSVPVAPVGVVGVALTPAAQGGSPFFRVERAGIITVAGSIYLVDGGGATWSDLQLDATANL